MTSPIGITLPIQRGNSGMFKQSYTMVEQIKSNLINLLLTRKGERLHQPEFGCDIHQFVFNPVTDDTLASMQLTITEAVDRWMPFLALDTVKVMSAKDTEVQLYVSYKFRSNPNILDSVTLTF